VQTQSPRKQTTIK